MKVQHVINFNDQGKAGRRGFGRWMEEFENHKRILVRGDTEHRASEKATVHVEGTGEMAFDQ